MKIIAVINYKGGVGKTTLTANLGAELAWRRKNVLMMDVDPQSSLTFSFITPDVWRATFADNRTIKTWLEAFDTGNPTNLSSLIHSPQRVNERLTGRGKLDLICSHLGLINVDLELATKLGGATLAQAKRNFLSLHRRLADSVSQLAEKEYDIILIDCPPNFNIITKMAIIACDYILVPARPDYLSTLGIEYLIRSVTELVTDYNDFASMTHGGAIATIDPKVLGVVFTMIQEYGGGPIAAHREFINQVLTMPGISMFEHYIKRNDTLFADAPQYGVPVVLHGYSSGSHQSVVDGLEEVTTEFRSAVGV